MTLKTTYLGLDLKTPFIVASGPWRGEGARIIDMVEDLSKQNWGGIVTKTYLKDSRLFMRPYLWSTKEYKGVGMQNSGSNLTEPTRKEMKGLKETCKKVHDEGLVIIGSIMGRSPNEWQELVEEVQAAGVDAVELNLSCPAKTSTIEQGIGYYLSQKPELAAETIQTVKKAAKVPVIAKLTPNVSNIAEIAIACKKAGADGISAINTVQGIIGIDVETGVPYSSDTKNRAYISGLSGPMIRPIGLRLVSEICSATDLPVMGIGGIENWKSAAEYIMVGASVVQVCTAFMWKGFKLGRRMYNGLSGFMERKGYESIEDFRGLSLQYITTSTHKMKVRAVVDREKCNGCRICLIACNESQYGAITAANEYVIINENRCQGCGLCNVVCPKDAISFVDV